ncbi:alpha/beta fold hydrolase [Blochmannia endosymbiont of Camponotus sp. C-003]|uniref:alpha/beta fold hydrolase n=1 Tax=unclassified Candidatus Blochmanniella TaxID=711328 RepID=UPI002024371B|nr:MULTISPECIES: alpha/beta fold hydrolase [unclassified Candidatus Blochmannia]URJ23487.1 alpha/beta fold hydrolase [Blochmannia endosymbiont of Camponotus sp. C-003]URJ28959.1 alpha/beta fold hydrolase [Blochmannia endosymbiont of Camponotus sp. C-046]
MQLNYRLQMLNSALTKTPVIMLHGLFGDLNNLGIIAEGVARYCCVVQVDLRNHGRSPHERFMNYSVMAQDILDLLDRLLIDKCIIIGHSMGGKVAMKLCMLAPHRITKVVIIDIAPIKYDIHSHDNIFHAIERVNIFGVKNRNEAALLMRQYCLDQSLIFFLLKSFRQGSWIFNFSSIRNNYIHISGWNTYQTWWGPALFIRGALSAYLDNRFLNDIYHQFPKARICMIPNAGHWVHWDNPVDVLSAISEFIMH